ncbi:TlpA family protein disulfide reductase [Limnoglobus roseus]|uniref:TlpA family protein disulfide reductase n=2 Tax=Limnoglobus roseus TaxID=2598579 RepID=A0A5C1AQZ5_9BACT|nr:TlpA family protein disulfide reductase [Limnoglobus roseus]
MRKFLATLAMTGAMVAASADDKKPADEKKAVEAKKVEDKGEKVAPPKKKRTEPTLKAGDKAPAFKADKWLQGAEVNEFASGKIYVVEFWATWCGPCIVMMPHMSEMQAEFKDKGVTFIGYTHKDKNGNTEEKVSAFVTKRGPALGYTFAYSDGNDTYENWMAAAGQNGIPCCFVVDKTGNIAYIGHPMFLDVVLPKVVDGSWKAEDSAKEVDAVEKEVDEVFKAIGGRGDAADGLAALAAFEKKYPGLSKIPYFVSPKLNLMIKAKKYDDVAILARNLITRGTKAQDDMLLGQVAAVLRSPDAKDQKALVGLSVKAAEAALKLGGDKDVRSLLGAAQSYFAAGEKAKAKEYGQKAVDAADERLKPQVERMVKAFDDEKKDEKKDQK